MDDPTSPPGPTLPPAGWHPDPAGRHEHRYWDGTRWSDHVSDRGLTSVDPVAGPGPAVVAAAQAQPVTPTVPTGAPPPSVPATSSGGMLDPASGWSPSSPTSAPPMMRSIGGLASSLTVVLWITVAVAVLGMLAFANRVTVASDILDFDFRDSGFGELVDLQQRADDADNFVGIAVLLMVVCSIAIFVLLVIWMWRVAKNAELAGRVRPRLGPGWTIGGWFIPLANLVIPVLVMQDLWRGSNPEVARGDADWRRSAGSAVVGWWWAAHIVAMLRFGGGGEAESRNELETLRTTDALAAGGSLAAIAAAVLLIVVVRRITRRQETLFAGAPLTPA
jgi:hypothetical protein